MSIREIDNFVKKFYQLWNAGHTAHLDVDTHAGKAWVGLQVQLGHAPDLALCIFILILLLFNLIRRQ